MLLCGGSLGLRASTLRLGREQRRERYPLALRQGSDRLVLRHPDRLKELPAASTPPPLLAHQQLADRHALDLPRGREHDLRRVRLSRGDLALQRGPRKPHSVRALQSKHVLWTRHGGSVHRTSQGQLQRIITTITPDSHPRLQLLLPNGPSPRRPVRPSNPKSYFPLWSDVLNGMGRSGGAET